MKVMHIIHGLNTGGAETLVKEYVTKLNKDKFESIILCYEHYPNSPYEHLIENSGIRIIYICDFIRPVFKKTIFEKFFNRIQRYLLIRKFIHKENPDIIHTHLLVNKYVKFAKPKRNTKIFHTIHGDLARYESLDLKDINALKWLIKRYDVEIICLHDKMGDEARKRLNTNKVVVLNNGIDIDKFNNVLSKKEVRKKLNIENLFVIGHVGRFSKVKNHDFLISVFREVCEKNDNAFLLMIGDGEEKKYIMDMLNRYGLNEKYMILSNRTDVHDIMRAMDIFIFPSISEGLGISLIEAQISKLPCIISDRIPERAIISNLVKVLPLNHNAEEWADEILNYELPKKIVLHCEEWDINKIVIKLEELYLGKE